MRPLVVTEYILNDGSVDTKTLREDLFDYFNTLHYMLSDTEFDHISKFASDWIGHHLADESTFEASVRAKARELASGDHVADYYKALLLRRDQLLAARDVFREYTSRLRDIFSDDRDIVLQALQQFDFDEGVYLRAAEYSQAREQSMQNVGALIDAELNEIENSIVLQEAAMDLVPEGDAKPKRKRAATKKKAATAEETPKKTTKSKRFFHKSL